MTTQTFTATCQRGHDPLTFDGDTKAFENHMRQAHKAALRTPGGACKQGSLQVPSMAAQRLNGLPAKYLRLNRAPSTTEGLTKVLADAVQMHLGVSDDWATDERVAA